MRSFMESNWIVSVWRNPNARTQTGIDSSSERTAIPTCESPITWLTGVSSREPRPAPHGSPATCRPRSTRRTTPSTIRYQPKSVSPWRVR